MRHGGGFGNSNQLIDPRAGDLWPLFKQSKEYGCQKELKVELLFCLKHLLVSQLQSIIWRNKDSRIVVAEPFMAPLELASIAFDTVGIEVASAGRGPGAVNYKDEIRIALEEYSKLYEFKVELEAIT